MERAKLIYASSADADMFYATGFHAPDPFAWVRHGRRQAALLSDLEIDRARSVMKKVEIISLSELEQRLTRAGRKPPYARCLAAFLEGFGLREAEVPETFPLGLARQLQKSKITLHPASGPFFPERESKSEAEQQAIRAACRAAEAGMLRAWEVLRAAQIGRGKALQWAGSRLTAQRLRGEIQAALVRAGAETRGDEIVACGEQACDPHERGHGPLLADRLIVLDIFPRMAATGFFGDLTRTVVRGRATEAQKRLWHTCQEGQRLALRALRPGACGADLQNQVRGYFCEQGYPTERSGGRWRGFFHGLGHGLGLEIHEPPRVGSTTLQPGHVVTIEPGIYWPGVGGVRHEDVAVITGDGHRLLTRLPKPLEL